MKFYYGYNYNYKDITDIIYNKLLNNNVVNIPPSDNERPILFQGDPYPNIVKHLYVEDTNEVFEKKYSLIVGPDRELFLDVNYPLEIQYPYNNRKWWHSEGKYVCNPYERIKGLQCRIKLEYSSFDDNQYERDTIVQFINENDNVIEVNGENGRNSIILATIIYDLNNFVSLEENYHKCNQVRKNIYNNSYNFNLYNMYIDSYLNLPENKHKEHHQNTLVAFKEDELYTLFNRIPSFFNIFNKVRKIITNCHYSQLEFDIFVSNFLVGNGFICIYTAVGNSPDKKCQVWMRF